MKLNKVKRQVAAGVLSQLFLSITAYNHALHRITAPGPHPDALGAGLTEGEKELLRKTAHTIHVQGEIMRKMSHRLRKEI